jgi:hypothetical protein
MQAQRPVAFDPVEIDHLRAIQDSDIAGLVDLRDQAFQDRMDRAGRHRGADRIQRQRTQSRPRAEPVALRLALQQPFFLQLPDQAVDGRFRQAQPLGHLDQPDRAP